jgi:hypothetical protein
LLGLSPYLHQKGNDFRCGDDRAMSQPLLLAMHNVWLREHNRIAEGIRKALAEMAPKNYGKQPEKDDEFIYQVLD